MPTTTEQQPVRRLRDDDWTYYRQRPSRSLTRDELADLVGLERHYLARDLVDEVAPW